MVRTKPRALANWPNNAVSVLDFGAVGDGVTDDTAAIQEAIDYAYTNNQTVYIPAGEYKISRIEDVRVTVIGAGWETEMERAAFGSPSYDYQARHTGGTILHSTATDGVIFEYGNGQTSPWVNGVSLKDFAIIGPGTGTSIGLYTNRIITGFIENIAVMNCYVGSESSYSQDIQYSNLIVWGCDTGLLIEDYATNQNVYVNFNANSCNTSIRMEAGSLNVFYGGLLQNSLNNVIVLDTSTSGEILYKPVFKDLWIEKSAAITDHILQIKGDDIHGVNFDGCRFISLSGGDFDFQPGSDCRNWIFQNNTITGSGNPQFDISSCGIGLKWINNRGFTTVWSSKGSSAVYDSIFGSFTGTIEGISETVTTDIDYEISGQTVTLKWETATGTSNLNTLKVTGLPNQIVPTFDSGYMVTRVQDDGSPVFGLCRVIDNELRFAVGPNATVFNTTGSKGILKGTTTYSMIR